MNNPIIKSVFLLIALYTLQSFNGTIEWLKSGSKPDSYVMEVDSQTERNRRNVNTIKSKEESVDGFGSYVIEIEPGKFAGKLIKITGYVKLNDTATNGGIWVMTDGTFKDESFTEQNENKSLVQMKEKSKDWSLCTMEVYIPADATNIAYGGFLRGGGQMWFDDVQIEISK